jgi:hypothetical protein
MRIIFALDYGALNNDVPTEVHLLYIGRVPHVAHTPDDFGWQATWDKMQFSDMTSVYSQLHAR